MVQSLNGTLDGCYTVPELSAGAYTVSLGSFFFTSASPPGSPVSPAGRPGVAITLSPASGPPGTTVAVHGRFLAPPPAKRFAHASVCWDGCATGLVQEGAPVHYSPGGSFTTSFQVPETAWLSATGPHPLTSGTYPVAIECLDPAGKGCAGQTQGQALFTLQAPPPSRCVPGKPCAQLCLVPDHARPGQVVHLEGWAPLQLEIGARPFDYQLQVRRGPAPPPGTVTEHTSPKGPSVTFSLGAATLHVTASPSLANLGPLHPGALQWASTPAVAAAGGDPKLLAYCTVSGIELSSDGGAHWSAVSTAGVDVALQAADLSRLSGAEQGCRQVALGPAALGSSAVAIYASFVVEPGLTTPGSFADVGMFTTDTGRTWQLVPTPKGMHARQFGGFHAGTHEVVAEFARAPSDPPRDGPTEPAEVEATSDGGRTWSQVPFSCPATGPCIRLGAVVAGNCAKGDEFIALWSSADGGRHWSQLAPVVNPCADVEVAALSSSEALLLAPAAAYPVEVTHDGGRRWTPLALPKVPGSASQLPSGSYGQTLSPSFQPLSYGDTLGLLPGGRLLLSRSQGPWLMLRPGATSWCHPPAAPSSSAQLSGQLPTVIGSSLWWLAAPSTAPAGAPPVLHRLPLSALTC